VEGRDALRKRAGYCRLLDEMAGSGHSVAGGWELLAGLDGFKRWSTETFTKCNSTAEDWSLVDVLQLRAVILRWDCVSWRHL
jgi:hypothetical protein